MGKTGHSLKWIIIHTGIVNMSCLDPQIYVEYTVRPTHLTFQLNIPLF